MQNTAYGIYRNGQIFLDNAPRPVISESRVQVTFLNEKSKGLFMRNKEVNQFEKSTIFIIYNSFSVEFNIWRSGCAGRFTK